EALADDPDINAVAGQQLARVTPIERERERWPRWSVAAVLVLGAIVGINQWLADTTLVDSEADIRRYVTRVGEQKTVDLADGTVLNLNTGTELLVELSGTRRKVTLRRGEAYFDVARDENRPFTVELGAQSITVLGTSFNVRTEPDSFDLTVLHGLVAVHPGTDQLTGDEPELKPIAGESNQVSAKSSFKVPANTKVQYWADSQRLLASHIPDAARYQQWRTGQLRFDDEPLYKVVKELNRYSAKKILIEDDAIMNMGIFALVNLNRLDNALLGLETTMPIKVTKHYDRIVIVGTREH
ncbi:MAG: FecR domain-containing protein, partial [Porticoccaceae bacterium]|nr:FecR domain-containing protein [Porticoccaceae bacterium]